MLAEIRLVFLSMPVLEIFDIDKLDLHGLIRLITCMLDNVLIAVKIGKAVDVIGEQRYYVDLFSHILILPSNLQLSREMQYISGI